MEISQIIYILIGKVQVFNVINYLSKSCTYGIAVIAGILAEKHVEYDDLILPLFIITLHHRQLVKICQQG